MINYLKASSFVANTAIASGQQAVDSGIQKAAVSPAGIAAVRDSFETAAKQVSFETSASKIAQPASLDEPVDYFNRASNYGKTISAHAPNQELLRFMSDPNLDLSAGVKQLNDEITNSLQDILKPKEQRKDLQDEIQSLIKELHEAEVESDKAAREAGESSESSFWGSIFLGPIIGTLTGSASTDIARYTATKKDDDD